MKPTDKAILGMVSKSPGRNASEPSPPGATLHAARPGDAARRRARSGPHLHYHTVTGALVLSPSPPRIAPSQLRLVE